MYKAPIKRAELIEQMATVSARILEGLNNMPETERRKYVAALDMEFLATQIERVNYLIDREANDYGSDTRNPYID